MKHNSDPKKLFSGYRNTMNCMWYVNLAPQALTAAQSTDTTEYGAATRQTTNFHDYNIKRDIIRYLHHSAGYAVQTTWCAVINKKILHMAWTSLPIGTHIFSQVHRQHQRAPLVDKAKPVINQKHK